jgi:hypothetical protein
MFKCLTKGCTGRYFVVNRKARGYWTTVYKADGTVDDTHLDGIGYGPMPKTVKCEECNKRQPNPLLKL